MSVEKLRQAEAFAGFLDFLSNPDKFKQLLSDVKKTIAEFDKVTEKYADFVDAEAYKRSLEQEYKDKDTKLNSEKDNFNRLVEKHNKSQQDYINNVVIANKDLEKRDAALKVREAEVKNLEEMQRKLADDRVSFEKEGAHFQSLVQDFKKRETALKAVLG
jgi:uncharacterized protein YdcH (DUF465 family)